MHCRGSSCQSCLHRPGSRVQTTCVHKPCSRPLLRPATLRSRGGLFANTPSNAAPAFPAGLPDAGGSRTPGALRTVVPARSACGHLQTGRARELTAGETRRSAGCGESRAEETGHGWTKSNRERGISEARRRFGNQTVCGLGLSLREDCSRDPRGQPTPTATHARDASVRLF